MDPVLQTMKDHGCDVDGALKRTLNGVQPEYERLLQLRSSLRQLMV